MITQSVVLQLATWINFWGVLYLYVNFMDTFTITEHYFCLTLGVDLFILIIGKYKQIKFHLKPVS